MVSRLTLTDTVSLVQCTPVIHPGAIKTLCPIHQLLVSTTINRIAQVNSSIRNPAT